MPKTDLKIDQGYDVTRLHDKDETSLHAKNDTPLHPIALTDFSAKLILTPLKIMWNRYPWWDGSKWQGETESLIKEIPVNFLPDQKFDPGWLGYQDNYWGLDIFHPSVDIQLGNSREFSVRWNLENPIGGRVYPLPQPLSAFASWDNGNPVSGPGNPNDGTGVFFEESRTHTEPHLRLQIRSYDESAISANLHLSLLGTMAFEAYFWKHRYEDVRWGLMNEDFWYASHERAPGRPWPDWRFSFLDRTVGLPVAVMEAAEGHYKVGGNWIDESGIWMYWWGPFFAAAVDALPPGLNWLFGASWWSEGLNLDRAWSNWKQKVQKDFHIVQNSTLRVELNYGYQDLMMPQEFHQEIRAFEKEIRCKLKWVEFLSYWYGSETWSRGRFYGFLVKLGDETASLNLTLNRGNFDITANDMNEVEL